MSSYPFLYVMPVVARVWSRVAGCLAIAWLSIVCAAQFAHGDVIYSNLGPNDSYFTSGWQFGQGEDMALPFTPIGGDYRLTSVEIALYRPFPGTFDLVLMSDAGGLPDSILDSMIVNVPTSGGLLSISFATNPLLTQGTQYWIASHTEPGGYVGVWNWSFTKGAFAGYYEGWNIYSCRQNVEEYSRSDAAGTLKEAGTLCPGSLRLPTNTRHARQQSYQAE